MLSVTCCINTDNLLYQYFYNLPIMCLFNMKPPVGSRSNRSHRAPVILALTQNSLNRASFTPQWSMKHHCAQLRLVSVTIVTILSYYYICVWKQPDKSAKATSWKDLILKRLRVSRLKRSPRVLKLKWGQQLFRTSLFCGSKTQE